MSKTLERREKLREALILAAERGIEAGGLTGLKTRELAREIGVANGAVYNLVEDMDELILRVGSRTLARLDAALSEAESRGPAVPADMLVRIALAYCDFAAENLQLWRALFEHRMAPGKDLPEWAIGEQMNMFRHIHRPLAWHGGARARAKADRGAAGSVAERGRDYRHGDGHRADPKA